METIAILQQQIVQMHKWNTVFERAIQGISQANRLLSNIHLRRCIFATLWKAQKP